MRAKIRMSNAGFLFKTFDIIEVEWVSKEEILGNESSPVGPVIRYVDRIETYKTEESAHMRMFCILTGYNKDGETERIAFDTEGYILNDNGKTIERL